MKYCTPDSFEGTPHKQHIIIPAVRLRKYIGEKYDGNAYLCRSDRGLTDDGEQFSSYEELESELFDFDNICQRCYKKAKSL